MATQRRSCGNPCGVQGIDSKRAKDVLATGVGSVAMISAITQAENPEAVVAELLALHESHR